VIFNNLQHYRGTKLSKNTGFSITSAERYSLHFMNLQGKQFLSQIEDQSSSILNLITSSEDFII
jgi:F-type H+-transporting ATPase subunit delta